MTKKFRSASPLFPTRFSNFPARQRWWAAFWGSSARLGFASAVLLSAALLFSALARTSRPLLPGSATSQGLSSADVDRRIRAAVTESEARQTRKTTQLVHELVQQVDTERSQKLIALNQVEYLQKQTYAMERTSGAYYTPASDQGGLK